MMNEEKRFALIDKIQMCRPVVLKLVYCCII